MATSTNLAKANATFCPALLNKLREDDNTKNVFFSPFCIDSALAMVMLGTTGNTASQMLEVLNFTEAEQPGQPQEEQPQMEQWMQRQMRSIRLPPYILQSRESQDGQDQDDVHSKFGVLLSEINKANAPCVVSVANRLYGEESCQFNEDFLDETKKHYEAELETVDFKADAEGARVSINSWVEEKTQGKIKDLLAEGARALVLVNAIYFKGNWNKQFKEEDTVDVPFKINKNETKMVKMMRQKSEFFKRSIPEVNAQVLVMPYEGKDLSMLIFLPIDVEDDTTGFEKLENELTYQKLVDWTCLKMMEKSEVEVSLPRFKMEATYDLKEVLTSMGMVDAFDVTKSDFSGMSPANDLLLSKVVHKSFVCVNEEGTEVAATTGAVVEVHSVTTPVSFIADHPFLFFIQHNTNKSILFAGRYCSPE